MKLPSHRRGSLIHVRLRRGLELGVATGADTKQVADLVTECLRPFQMLIDTTQIQLFVHPGHSDMGKQAFGLSLLVTEEL